MYSARAFFVRAARRPGSWAVAGVLALVLLLGSVWMPARSSMAGATPPASDASPEPVWQVRTESLEGGERLVLRAPDDRTRVEIVLRAWKPSGVSEDRPLSTEDRDAIHGAMLRHLERRQTLEAPVFRRLPVTRMADQMAYRVQYAARQADGMPLRGVCILVLPTFGTPVLVDVRTNGSLTNLEAVRPLVEERLERALAHPVASALTSPAPIIAEP